MDGTLESTLYPIINDTLIIPALAPEVIVRPQPLLSETVRLIGLAPTRYMLRIRSGSVTHGHGGAAVLDSRVRNRTWAYAQLDGLSCTLARPKPATFMDAELDAACGDEFALLMSDIGDPTDAREGRRASDR
jgi:hypothetical protein